MYGEILKRISLFIFRNSKLNAEDKEICVYGAIVILSTIFNYSIILGIGFCINRFIETFFYLLVYSVIRSQTGGYHADSKSKCLLGFIIVYFIVVLMERKILRNIDEIIIIMLLLVNLIIYILSPIQTQKIQMGVLTRRKLKVRSCIVTSCFSIISICFYYFQKKLICVYMVSALITVSSMVVFGRIKYSKENQK